MRRVASGRMMAGLTAGVAADVNKRRPRRHCYSHSKKCKADKDESMPPDLEEL